MPVQPSLLLKLAACSEAATPLTIESSHLRLSRTELAQLLNVSPMTVREWERKGLLPDTVKNANGWVFTSWPALRTVLREVISRGFALPLATSAKRGPALGSSMSKPKKAPAPPVA